jgi:hypothetical protein
LVVNMADFGRIARTYSDGAAGQGGCEHVICPVAKCGLTIFLSFIG